MNETQRTHTMTDEHRYSRYALHVVFVVTALAFLPNAHDSAAIKLPLLLVTSLLVAGLFVSESLWRGSFTLQATPVDIPLLLGILLALVSAALTWHPGSSGSAVTLAGSFLVCFAAGATIFSRPEDVARLRATVTVLATLLLTVGFIQLVAPAVVPVEFYLGSDQRPVSTLGSPQFLSSFIVLIVPLVLTQLLSSRGTAARGALVLLVSGLLALLLATGTRSSLIALGPGMLVFILLTRGAARRGTVAASGIMLIVIVTGAFLVPRLGSRLADSFAGGAHSSFLRRESILEAGFRAFLASPVIGHGFGQFESVLPPFRAPDYWTSGSEDVVPHAHCEPLEIGVEIGAPGLLLALLVIVGVIRSGIRDSRSAGGELSLMAAAVTAGIVGVLIDGLMNVSLRQPPIAALIASFMGLLFSPALTSTRKPLQTSFPPLRAVAWVPLTLWAVFLAILLRQQERMVVAEGELSDATIAEASGRTDDAARGYERAAHDNPVNCFALFNDARLMLATGHPDNALATVRALQTISPDYPKSHLISAASLFGLGDRRSAEEELNREIRLRRHPEAYALKARFWRAEGDTTAERRVTAELLESCIRGNIRTLMEFSAARLVATSRTRQELVEAGEILRRLHLAFPDSAPVGVQIATADSILSRAGDPAGGAR